MAVKKINDLPTESRNNFIEISVQNRWNTKHKKTLRSKHSTGQENPPLGQFKGVSPRKKILETGNSAGWAIQAPCNKNFWHRSKIASRAMDWKLTLFDFFAWWYPFKIILEFFVEKISHTSEQPHPFFLGWSYHSTSDCHRKKKQSAIISHVSKRRPSDAAHTYKIIPPR